MQRLVAREPAERRREPGVAARGGEAVVVRDAEALEHHLQQIGERLRRAGLGDAGDEAVERIRPADASCSAAAIQSACCASSAPISANSRRSSSLSAARVMRAQ